MVVVLNGERLEPSLPDMGTGPALAVISPGVSHKQPLHPTAQVPVALRADNHVEVVGHHDSATRSAESMIPIVRRRSEQTGALSAFALYD
jgi:hypothetical protein